MGCFRQNEGSRKNHRTYKRAIYSDLEWQFSEVVIAVAYMGM